MTTYFEPVEQRLTRKQVVQRGVFGFAGLTVLAGCGGDGDTEGAQERKRVAGSGGTLLFATLGASATQVLDPHRTYHETSMLLYDRLTSLQPDLETIKPDLAAAWESSDDFQVWTVHLQQGVFWHDGQPFTAKDVVHSFRRMMLPETASPHAVVMSPINPDGIEATGNDTVVFRLKAPMWDFMHQAASNFASVVPAHIPEDKLQKDAVGTGPFVIKSFKPGQELHVTKNAKYWKKGFPKLDVVREFFISEPAARINGLKTRQFNLANELSTLDVRTVEGTPNLRIETIPSGRYVDFAMNLKNKPFSDIRVREALALSADRETMNERVFDGKADIGNDQPIAPVNLIYADSVEPRSYDPDRAKQLLADSGYANGLDLELFTAPLFPGMVEMSILFKEQAAPAGFRINVKQTPAGTYLDQIYGRKGFYAMAFEMRIGDPLLLMPFSSDGPWNVDGYKSREFDEALNAAKTSTDEATRMRHYADAQRILSKDVAAVIPLFQPVIEAAYESIQNYAPTAVSLQRDFRDLWIST